MSKNTSIPYHVAIVMDGNGRWAKKRFMPRTAGHREGVKAVQKTIQACADAGVKVLTLFAFSSENWKRPESEVVSLMDLFVSSLEKEVRKLNENGIQLKFIGDRTQFSDKLQAKIEESEQLTSSNHNFLLNIAANYGGRWDIVNATQNIARKVEQGELKADAINEHLFQSYISIGDIPDPDLCIRTGGEKRLSNFLLWQFAYTEFYFTETFWPEFSEKDLDKALDSYAKRQRRYGMLSEQVEA